MTGGGMNVRFGLCGEVKFLNAPERFEAGTLNLEAIYGFNETLKYLMKIGMENIEKREKSLRNYAISRLKENPNIIIYNEKAESGIISFNYKNVFAQDEATYLNSKGIAVRSGQHCAKLLDDFLKSQLKTPEVISTSSSSFKFPPCHLAIKLCISGKNIVKAIINTKNITKSTFLNLLLGT